MAFGRARSLDKIPDGGRGSPRYAQKRPGGHTISLSTITSMASRNHILIIADSTLTDGDYVIDGVSFLAAVMAGVSIAYQYLLAKLLVMRLVILSGH